MSTFRRLALMSLAATLVAGCASDDDRSSIRTRYDATVNYGAIHTFAWGAGSDQGPYAADVRAALASQMAKRGVAAAPGAADTTLSFYLMARGADGALPEGRALGYLDTQGRPATLEPARQFMANRVAAAHEGLIVVDLVDRASGRLLWRSMALTEINRSLSGSEQRGRIEATAKELFGNYPVKK